MALPAARRPAYAQKLLDEESQQLRHQSLKLKINKGERVISDIGKWYKTLGEKEKRELTPKRFKRRVLRFCYDISFDYDHLPRNWLDTLQGDFDLNLVEKRKRKIEPLKFPAYVLSDEDELDDDIVDFGWLFKEIKDSTMDEQISGTSGSAPRYTITANTSSNQDDGSFRETRATFRKRRNLNNSESYYGDNLNQSTSNDESQDTSSGDCQGTSNEDSLTDVRRNKRIIDLTDEPPPTKWLAALLKGTPLPRVLRIHSSNDMNILYYDYEPTAEEYPPGLIVKTAYGVGFQWWDKEIRNNVKEGRVKK